MRHRHIEGQMDLFELLVDETPTLELKEESEPDPDVIRMDAAEKFLLALPKDHPVALAIAAMDAAQEGDAWRRRDMYGLVTSWMTGHWVPHCDLEPLGAIPWETLTSELPGEDASWKVDLYEHQPDPRWRLQQWIRLAALRSIVKNQHDVPAAWQGPGGSETRMKLRIYGEISGDRDCCGEYGPVRLLRPDEIIAEEAA